MLVSVQPLTNWAVRIPDMVTDENLTERTAWIVPALFFTAKYVKDARHRVRERIEVENIGLRQHENNVVFEPTIYPDSPL